MLLRKMTGATTETQLRLGQMGAAARVVSRVVSACRSLIKKKKKVRLIKHTVLTI